MGQQNRRGERSTETGRGGAGPEVRQTEVARTK